MPSLIYIDTVMHSVFLQKITPISVYYLCPISIYGRLCACFVCIYVLQALLHGIDGWKCDGTDPYILELIVPLGKRGIVTRKQYSDAYYGDFFDYTRTKRGNGTLIMSRPADGLEFMVTTKQDLSVDIRFFHRYGPIFLDFSPQRVMYSGWVGDNDPNFGGLEDALKSYLQSAWASESSVVFV